MTMFVGLTSNPYPSVARLRDELDQKDMLVCIFLLFCLDFLRKGVVVFAEYLQKCRIASLLALLAAAESRLAVALLNFN